MTFNVLVEGEGLEEVEVVRLPAGATGHEIVAQIAERVGFPVDEAFLFVEDEDLALDLSVALLKEVAEKRVHHVNRAKTIAVHVFYKNLEISRDFAPSARVQRVLDWAVRSSEFTIDPTIAPEMELALQGSEKPLPKNAHIGRYVHHAHAALAFDLVRGVVPNGYANECD